MLLPLCTAQAQVYFPDKLYDMLEDALISYGETHLGCRAISPIWMSYYVDGCVQVRMAWRAPGSWGRTCALHTVHRCVCIPSGNAATGMLEWSSAARGPFHQCP